MGWQINKILQHPFVLFLFWISGVLLFQQHDYELDFYRLEITSFEKSFLGNGTKAITYKYNRTQAVVNATFDMKIDFGYDVEVIVQTYKFKSNEYREFPIRFEFNLCHGLKENYFGIANFYKLGNYCRCPITKGHYYFSKWAPDESKFPPYIPSGKYLLMLEFEYFSKQAMVIGAYAEIKRPIVVMPTKKSNH